jgi:hypothetical protein
MAEKIGRKKEKDEEILSDQEIWWTIRYLDPEIKQKAIIDAPQRGQCHRQASSERTSWVPARFSVALLEASSCRLNARREARKRFAKKPK